MRKLKKLLWYVGFFKRYPIILRFPVLIEPDDNGYFAWIPGWKDVFAPGDTKEEALTNIRDTAIAVCRSYARREMDIPRTIPELNMNQKDVSYHEIIIPVYA